MIFALTNYQRTPLPLTGLSPSFVALNKTKDTKMASDLLKGTKPPSNMSSANTIQLDKSQMALFEEMHSTPFVPNNRSVPSRLHSANTFLFQEFNTENNHVLSTVMMSRICPSNRHQVLDGFSSSTEQPIASTINLLYILFSWLFYCNQLQVMIAIKTPIAVNEVTSINFSQNYDRFSLPYLYT